MKELWVELNKRILRFDGVSIVDSADVPWLFKNGVQPEQVRVLDQDQDVLRFNQEVPIDKQLRIVTDEPIQLSFNWNIPPEFRSIDIETFVIERFTARLSELAYTEDQLNAASDRIGVELRLFKEAGLNDLLRTICFVLHEFEQKQIVWGVGRGSSCASYLLFIIGLHEVDPIKNDIDISEFFHTGE